MPGRAPNHSEAFERRAVAMFENRGLRSAREIAAELGVSASRIYFWRAKYAEETDAPLSAAPKDNENENARYALLRERDQLKMETAALRQTIVLLGCGH